MNEKPKPSSAEQTALLRGLYGVGDNPVQPGATRTGRVIDRLVGDNRRDPGADTPDPGVGVAGGTVHGDRLGSPKGVETTHAITPTHCVERAVRRRFE